MIIPRRCHLYNQVVIVTREINFFCSQWWPNPIDIFEHTYLISAMSMCMNTINNKWSDAKSNPFICARLFEFGMKLSKIWQFTSEYFKIFEKTRKFLYMFLQDWNLKCFFRIIFIFPIKKTIFFLIFFRI